MVLQRLKKLTAYILILSMMGSFMPSLAFAQDEVPKEKVKTLDELTKEDVVEKTEDSTTYDLGKGQKMTVLYGGEVRYKDDKGKLKDYDASLVKINEGERTEHKRELKGYSLRNKKGDTMQYLPSRLSEETPLIMESDEYSIRIRTRRSV